MAVVLCRGVLASDVFPYHRQKKKHEIMDEYTPEI